MFQGFLSTANRASTVRNSPELSVCICTYNGALRIGEVLAALGAQQAPPDAWETIVIDNASTDDTPVIVDAALQQHLPGRSRCVRELKPGLMHARRRATAEARGAAIAFLDDDNIPAPDYISRALDVLRRHPEAGVIGGRVYADWVGEPSPLGRAVADFALAICDRGDCPFAYQEVTGGPAGAGMIVRRAFMQQIFEDPELADRIGGRNRASLLSGEDTAIVIRAHQLGYAVRYEPSLVLFHRIPASRTSREYLARLYEGIGRGQAMMRPLFDPKARRPGLAVLIAVKDIGRWLRGLWFGPDRKLRAEHGDLARDVHALQQRQLYGRFRQTLRGVFR